MSATRDTGRKAEEYAAEMPPPPEIIRLRWLGLLEALIVDWRTVVELPPHERRFARNIIRWIMADRGARLELPEGYRVQAWIAGKDFSTFREIVLMRTR